MRWKTVFAACTALLAMAALAVPASAARSSATGITVNYKLLATTHIKKLNQNVTIKNGRMLATVDLVTGNLTGHLTLPPATVTTYQAGYVPLTATFQMKEAKPVKGHVDFTTLHVRATSVFNILIKSAYLGPLPIFGLVPVNLVGNKCTTSKAVSVTMSGPANFTGPSTFTGTYTIPKFKTCSAATPLLNQLIPGPGNTFKAVATPST